MMMDRLKQLREDIEGACDLSISERLREQHRTAALKAAALMEAFTPVIVCKDELVLRAGERGQFRVQDPGRSVEIAGEGEIVETRHELDKDGTMRNIIKAGRWGRRPQPACEVNVRLWFTRATIRRI